MADTNADELRAQIAALAGRINRHKNTEAEDVSAHQYAPGTKTQHLKSEPCQELNIKVYGRGRGRGRGYNSSSWTYQRGSPYGAYRGRGDTTRPQPHRHRSLVLNAPSQAQQSHPPAATVSRPNHDTGNGAPGWVTKTDRHMQLINNSVYAQKTQERTQAIEETRQHRQKAREAKEKAKLQNHLHALSEQTHSTTHNTPAPAAPHQIMIHDIRFLITDGGSKLIKVKGEQGLNNVPNISSTSIDDLNQLKPTPRRANVGGVTFLRSKHGNLYRAGLIKTMRRNDIRKIQQPCPQFSTSGSCPKGPQCRYIHDPTKVAICPDFLRAGECQAGLDCDLSHDSTPERVPACLHFLRGNCTNDNCRYAHVRVNPGAPVCRAFATLGYCSKGAMCPERHVHECPDYANKGLCRNKKCRLPHVDRAGALRKAAAAQQDVETMSTDATSDISSDDDDDQYDSDDVDSDDFEEDFLMPDGNHHELSQQSDYVKF